MKHFLIWASILATSAMAADPATSLQMDRKQIQAQTVEIVGTAMNLDPSNAETFWGIFNQYEAERQKIGDKRVALIQSFAEVVDTMTNEQARSMAEQSFSLEKQLLALKEKYFKIMEKQISAKVAARFVQVMNQIDSVVNSQISREMPLIGGF